MNIFKNLPNPFKRKGLQTVLNTGGGWFPVVSESFGGAWQAGAEITKADMLAHGVVYACVSLIASDIGKLPINVTQNQNGIWAKSNTQFDSLFRQPNSYQNRAQFFSAWIVSKLLNGNTYAFKVRDAYGRVIALKLLDPQKVKVLVSEDDSVFYQINGGTALQRDGEVLTIPAREMIHDRGVCLNHPLVGVSPIAAAALAAGQGMAIQQASAKFFSNGSKPSGVLTAPGAISDEVAARLAEFIGALVDTAKETNGIKKSTDDLARDGSIREWATNAAKSAAFVIDAFDGVKRTVEIVGKTIGAAAAQAASVAQGNFRGAMAVGAAWQEDIDGILNRPMFSDGLNKRLADMQANAGTKPDPKKELKYSAGGDSGSGKGKKDKTKAEADPLIESAKLYSDAMKALNDAQLKADTSGLKLTSTQAELARVMSDPLFGQMPETWRIAVAAQAEYTLQAEKAAEEQRRLNELLAATPTAQLEKSRETMQFLASAFEQGKISAEQFSEAAQAALSNIPDAAKPATDAFLDMTLVANDAANMMADSFTDVLFNPMDKSIKDMLASFLKAIARMIAQALILKAIKTGMGAMGIQFARGGVFDQGGVQAFASGGVVTRPTPFKFASGGSFKNGLMGEAGPEAILPLKRGSDGRLGVTMNSSGGAGDTVVNITVNQSGGESQSSNGTNNDARALAGKIKGVVLEVITTEKRPGGLLFQ